MCNIKRTTRRTWYTSRLSFIILISASQMCGTIKNQPVLTRTSKWRHYCVMCPLESGIVWPTRTWWKMGLIKYLEFQLTLDFPTVTISVVNAVTCIKSHGSALNHTDSCISSPVKTLSKMGTIMGVNWHLRFQKWLFIRHRNIMSLWLIYRHFRN